MTAAMDTLRVLAALGLPWLLGALAVHRLVAPAPPGRRALVLGYGFLLGVLALTLCMRALDHLGLPLRVPVVLAPLLLLTLALGVLQWQRPRAFGVALGSDGPGTLPRWQRLLMALLVAAVALRLAGFWLEVSWRPLFPWDAYMHWATKAKVWAEAQALLPFVSYDDWLAAGGAGVYTDNHPDYPITTPLLQTWMALLLGRFDDALVNLPWVALLAAAVLLLFAQARRAGAGPLAAVVFCYFLASMPMVNLQTALAGYADVFLGAFYLAAVAAFYHWSQTRDWRDGLLALACAAACPLIKNEGLFWLLSFGPALAVRSLPWRWSLALLASAVALGVAALLLAPADTPLAGHTLARLDLHLRAEALRPLLESWFVHANWHLLFWLLAALLAASLGLAGVMRRAWPPSLAAVGAALGTAVALFLVLFLFTGYAGGAMRHTADNRIMLQLAPALLFFCLLLWLWVYGLSAKTVAGEAPAPGGDIGAHALLDPRQSPG